MIITLDRNLTLLDLETTGVKVGTDRIVQIALLTVTPDGEEHAWDSLIDPEVPIPKEASDIHGITAETVAGAPKFSQIAGGLVPWLTDCDLGGFNHRKFDLPMLAAEFARAGMSAPWASSKPRILDGMELYRKVAPGTLAGVYRQYMGKELEGAHGAKADIKATWDVIQAMLTHHEDIPRDVEKLNTLLQPPGAANFIDGEGKLIWGDDGKAVMNFSANKGKPLTWMASNDKGFLNWMVKKGDFSAAVMEHIHAALSGKFFSRNQGQ